MDNKVDAETWIRVTIFVAVIGCIGATASSFIGIIPDLLKLSPTATAITIATDTLSPTPSPISTQTPTISSTTIVSTNTLTSPSFIYENFDNSTYNDSFNRQLWTLKDVSGGQATQENGILEFSYSGVPKGGIALVTNIYDFFAPAESVFFEAQLKVDNPQDGHVYILINNSGLSTYTDCMLGYGNKNAWFSCNYVDDGQARYTAEPKYVDYKKWHTVRIELNSNLMTYTYFLNNEIIGSYKPATATPQVSFQFGVYAASTNNINGYVDNIRIGALNK